MDARCRLRRFNGRKCDLSHKWVATALLLGSWGYCPRFRTVEN